MRRPDRLVSTRARAANATLPPGHRLHDQCPGRFRAVSSLLCPWYAPRCPNATAESAVASISRAEIALRREGLSPAREMQPERVPPAEARLLQSERFRAVRERVAREPQPDG